MSVHNKFPKLSMLIHILDHFVDSDESYILLVYGIIMDPC